MDIDMAQTLLQLHGNRCISYVCVCLRCHVYVSNLSAACPLWLGHVHARASRGCTRPLTAPATLVTTRVRSLGAGQLPAAGTSGQPVAEGAALHTQQDAAAPMAPGGTRKRARSDSTPGQAKAPAAKGSPTGSSKKAAGEGRHKATVLQTLQAQASARLQAAQLPQQAGAMAGPAATWPHLLSHPCSSWSLAHVRTWLEGQGCGAVVDLFEAQQMDGAALKGLMRVVGGDGAKLLAVLAEVGVQPMGQRLRLADCLLQLFEL